MGCAGWLSWKGTLGPGGEVGKGLECWQVAEDSPSSLEVMAGPLTTGTQEESGSGTVGQTGPRVSPRCAAGPL